MTKERTSVHQMTFERALAELVAEKVDDVMAVTVAGLQQQIDLLTLRLSKAEARMKK